MTRRSRSSRHPALRWQGYAAAIGLAVAAMALGLVFRRLPHANLSLLFLLAVVLTAARWGLVPSIVCSLLGFVALNFFFTPPYYTFAVEQQGDIATLVFFLAMAALTASLASRARIEMASNRAALNRVSTLLEFSRRLAAAADVGVVVQALADQAGTIVGARAVAVLPSADGARPEIAATSATSRAGPEPDDAAFRDAWRAGAGPVRTNGWTCLPLATTRTRVGILAVAAVEIRHQQRQLLDGLCDQAAAAVERIQLVDSLRDARVRSEREQLRSALLASVSHDLRTPLASIVGCATSLLEYGGKLQETDRIELLQTVRDESLRLDRYIQNLLEMTRFGQQAFKPKRDWVSLHDLIGSAIRRLAPSLPGRDVRLDIAPEAELVHVHGALIEQVLVNLLDNAADFAPAGTTIEVRAYPAEGATVIEVDDQGPGVPNSEREKIFDLFHRAAQGDSGRQGTGLGLAICRSIVSAHGGSIEALPLGPSGGTRMRIHLPIESSPTDSAALGEARG